MPRLALEVNQVTVRHGQGSSEEVLALDAFSAAFVEGECTALVGPSGCGKTTLLDAIAGLVRPTSGSILFPVRPKRLGYVFQDYPFLPRMTARRHVEFPLTTLGLPHEEVSSRATAWLEQVGLLDAADRPIPALSQGMRARASLATALIARPEIVLLDEPFGPLDLETRVAMWRQLQRFRADTGATVLLVTHDLNEAIALADRVLVLDRSPARVISERRTGFGRSSDVLEVLEAEAGSRLFRELWSDLRQALRDREE